MFKRYTREEVIECIRSAFRKVAEFDYGYKFTHNEEDIRASQYRYIREFLDVDQNWRVFLSYSTNPDNEKLRKPDLMFTKRGKDDWDWSLEIIVEMKNWPTVDAIVDDCKKMVILSQKYEEDSPHLMFLGILGSGKDIDNCIFQVHKQLKNVGFVEIILYPHDGIFRGVWDSENKTDPWLKKFRW